MERCVLLFLILYLFKVEVLLVSGVDVFVFIRSILEIGMDLFYCLLIFILIWVIVNYLVIEIVIIFLVRYFKKYVE